MTSNKIKLDYSTKLSAFDRGIFDCGIRSLNIYLQKQASQDVKKNLAICYLAIIDSKIVGFYTLSQHLIKRQELFENFQRTIPKTYDAPATLIGRLAIDKKYQGKGYGTLLLMHALYTINIGAKISATTGAVVIAKDNSENFYLKNGFIRLSTHENKYFLPIDVIRRAVTLGVGDLWKKGV